GPGAGGPLAQPRSRRRRTARVGRRQRPCRADGALRPRAAAPPPSPPARVAEHPAGRLKRLEARMARLSEQEIASKLAELEDWDRADAATRRRYPFADFKAAMIFVNRVAALAEELDHPPDILIEYNKVTLTLTSHDAGGLTGRDFRLALRIDA